MTIMQRPDKIPAGPTEGRFFALCAIGGFDVQSYPNYQHFVVRLLLVKYNKWYGSLFELHCTKKDNSVQYTYFDFLFLNYFLKPKEKIKVNAQEKSNAKDEKINFIGYAAFPWKLIDKSFATIMKSKVWEKIDAAVPKPTNRSKKGSVNKRAL